MIDIKYYIKSIIGIISLLLLAITSNIFLGNEKYMLTAVVAAIISCIPFFTRFEKNIHNSREIVMTAVMIALCIAGRFIFIQIPHFKPVTALVIITGLYFGADCGFITGSITALISNMQYGQGPWTVFQMAVWGFIGLLAGALNIKGLFFKKRWLLFLFAGLSGVLFSLIMDIYTTLSFESFSISRYITYVMFSFPVMLEYIISNIIFIIILEKPIGKKLTRIKTKYGLFDAKKAP